MTYLRKPVRRNSYAKIRERGKEREIVIILEPPNLIGLRAKGCRRVYRLTAEAAYVLAVRAEVLSAAKKLKLKKGKA